MNATIYNCKVTNAGVFFCVATVKIFLIYFDVRVLLFGFFSRLIHINDQDKINHLDVEMLHLKHKQSMYSLLYTKLHILMYTNLEVTKRKHEIAIFWEMFCKKITARSVSLAYVCVTKTILVYYISIFFFFCLDTISVTSSKFQSNIEQK